MAGETVMDEAIAIKAVLAARGIAEQSELGARAGELAAIWQANAHRIRAVAERVVSPERPPIAVYVASNGTSSR